MSAFFAGFTLVFTDFGAPKVVGGNYNVMAVDIYKRVVGQQDFYMGATISIILLIPALLSFFADRIVQRKQTAGLSAKSKPFVPKSVPRRDWVFFGFSWTVAIAIILMVAVGFYASIVKMWPYDFSINFSNYFFEETAGSRGLTPFYNSLKLAFYTAVFGTILSFLSAYFVTKSRDMERFKKSVSVLSLIPLALPGLVIGFSYIFFFNRPTIFGMANPFSSIYGTMAILVLSNMIHFYTVSFMTAKTALQQLDNEFDTVSESMGIPFWTTFRRVTVPVCLPAIIEIFMYYFASSMATVSAVIFLYSPKTIPATVSIINMDDAGDQAPALAMCMLIIVTNVIIKIISEVVLKKLKKKRSAH
jgi:iron(III) transport system permease protein